MTIVSTNVGLTDTATGTDFNNLRADLLDNHIHDGISGSTIDHTDLTHDGHSIVNEHEEIDEHIGDVKNIHGKGTSTEDEYIAGVVGGDYAFIVFGHNTTQSLGNSRKWEDIPIPVTMANTGYRVFISSHSNSITWFVKSRQVDNVRIEVGTDKNGESISSGTTFDVMIVGIPERP